jgi:hypothetical protein
MTQLATLRAYANLPSEVPDALLQVHLDNAQADLLRMVAIPALPVPAPLEWSEAVVVRALASVFPWLNTFALDGAAKVGRLEGSVEFRFLTPDDVEARIGKLNARFEVLLRALRTALNSDPSASVITDGFSFDAV